MCVHAAYCLLLLLLLLIIIIIIEHYNSVTNAFDVQVTAHRDKFL